MTACGAKLGCGREVGLARNGTQARHVDTATTVKHGVISTQKNEDGYARCIRNESCGLSFNWQKK